MTLKEIGQKLEDLIPPVLETAKAFLVGTRVRVERGSTILQVFVDTDTGITIDQCALISRELSGLLEMQKEFTTIPYLIEVSSPGLDQPLKLLRQYRKNVGRRFHVQFATDTQPGTLTGTLIGVEDDQLTFQPDAGEPLSLPFTRILESKEELPW